jgi:hypothetical protein
VNRVPKQEPAHPFSIKKEPEWLLLSLYLQLNCGAHLALLGQKSYTRQQGGRMGGYVTVAIIAFVVGVAVGMLLKTALDGRYLRRTSGGGPF